MTGTGEPGNGRGAGRLERRRRLRRGGRGEFAAAVLLMAKGYRIIARRHRTPFGEIDIIAVRRRRLAFVEVKRRASREEAEAALTPHQARRIADAVDHWLARNAAYREHDICLDAVLVLPWSWPRHLPNALEAE
jgi:putative endonuclease